jgi:hypothetical protein
MDIRLSRSFYLFLIICTSSVFAQAPAADIIATKQASALSGTLAQQYDEVVIRSGSYKIYKNIKKTKIEELWKNVNDSLKQQQQLVLQSKAGLEKSAQTIIAMQNEIDSFKASGSSIGKLSTIGTSIKGSSDSMFLWAALLLLAAALAYAIFRMRSAVKEASYRSGLYDQLFEELREHRSKANEREKKLARELQTERNRVEELTGNNS